MFHIQKRILEIAKRLQEIEPAREAWKKLIDQGWRKTPIVWYIL